MSTPISFFFYCPPLGPPERTGYAHGMIALAEGLRELKIPFYANVDHWRGSPGSDDYLFRHDPHVGPHDCSVVVLDNCWPYHQGITLPSALRQRSHESRTIYMDLDDSYPSEFVTQFGSRFDLVLRPHWTSTIPYPDNVRPWAFGPTERILDYTRPRRPFAERSRSVLVSFRVAHPVRTFTRRSVIPLLKPIMDVEEFTEGFAVPPSGTHDYFLWQQTGRRHSAAYFERLCDSQVAACFGGSFAQGATQAVPRLRMALDRAIRKVRHAPHPLFQWDSWRPWETWAAGAAVLHIDLPRHGALLPEMPKNWEHYIGIDLERPERSLQRLLDDPSVLPKVASDGRSWMLKHYSPRATALRVLDLLREKSTETASPGERLLQLY